MNKIEIQDQTSSIDKQEQSNQNEPTTSENRNTTQSNNTEQTLTQEQKINSKNLKRMMNGKKTTLPSLRNRIEYSQDGNGKNKSSTNIYINK